LQGVLRDTTTNCITSKSNELVETLVTNALRAQFIKEVAPSIISLLAAASLIAGLGLMERKI